MAEIVVVASIVAGALGYLGYMGYKRISSREGSCGSCGSCGPVPASGDGDALRTEINLLTTVTADDRRA